MQIKALNQEGHIILAQSAQRQISYFCPECSQEVQVRRGHYRRPHFYHLHGGHLCRQQGKSLTHMAAQEWLQTQILKEYPTHQVELEYHIPGSNRIADVAWLEERLVIEVQCSPMEPELFLERSNDYATAGWRVIWLFHDRYYFTPRVRMLELHWDSIPHYYTNLTAQGEGTVYDRLDEVVGGVRHYLTYPTLLDVTQVHSEIAGSGSATNHLALLELLAMRRKWPVHFGKDLYQLQLKGEIIRWIDKTNEWDRRKETLLGLVKRWAKAWWQGVLENYTQR